MFISIFFEVETSGTHLAITCSFNELLLILSIGKIKQKLLFFLTYATFLLVIFKHVAAHEFIVAVFIINNKCL